MVTIVKHQLTSVTVTLSATFVYDGDGNRVKSTIGTITTAFVGNHTEWEVASSSLTRYYYAGSTRVAMRKNNTVYYVLGDHLGSTSVTTDQNGQNPAKQLYAPWGEVRYSSGSLQTKYTYTGQYSNVGDFGLMFYNARWYDPLLSRFTSADSIVPQPGNPQAWDRYSYVQNSPINYTDPSGHRTCLNKEDCNESGNTPYEGWASRHPKEPWKDDVNYDETTNSLPGWCSDGCLNDTTRTHNSYKVWTWICKSGGWWGSGCPSGKDLAAFLLWKEGGTFYNFDLYSGNQSDMAGRIMAGYFNYLFEDNNGITAYELSKFTAFFNPKLGTAFNSSDWNTLVGGPSPNSNFVTAVDTYYSKGPVIENGYIVSRWWDTTESFPCSACTVYTSIDLVDQTRRTLGTFYFGYIP